MQADTGTERSDDSGILAEYWSWVGGALYLLLTLDLLTTIYAAHLYGPQAELNPVMRWALGQELYVLVGLYLVVLILLVGLFAGFFRLLQRASGTEGWMLAKSFELWIGLLIAVGLFVFANNLSVIVLGGSLI